MVGRVRWSKRSARCGAVVWFVVGERANRRKKKRLLCTPTDFILVSRGSPTEKYEQKKVKAAPVVIKKYNIWKWKLLPLFGRRRRAPSECARPCHEPPRRWPARAAPCAWFRTAAAAPRAHATHRTGKTGSGNAKAAAAAAAAHSYRTQKVETKKKGGEKLSYDKKAYDGRQYASTREEKNHEEKAHHRRTEKIIDQAEKLNIPPREDAQKCWGKTRMPRRQARKRNRFTTF